MVEEKSKTEPTKLAGKGLEKEKEDSDIRDEVSATSEGTCESGYDDSTASLGTEEDDEGDYSDSESESDSASEYSSDESDDSDASDD